MSDRHGAGHPSRGVCLGVGPGGRLAAADAPESGWAHCRVQMRHRSVADREAREKTGLRRG